MKRIVKNSLFTTILMVWGMMYSSLCCKPMPLRSRSPSTGQWGSAGHRSPEDSGTAAPLIYQEDAKVFTSILGTMAILLFIGVLGTLFKPKNYRIYTKEGMLIVALCWVLWSFFGGLPFVFAGQIPSVIDAFFEMSSGFTTTGATILTDTGVLTHSLLFWRSFAHLIGGMGVLVFALAIMNNSKNVHHEVMRAEVPGPVFGKVVAKSFYNYNVKSEYSAPKI